MANGGYKIISLHNLDFTIGTGQTIPGIYEEIEGNYRKPILLSDIVIEGVEKPDRFVVFGTEEGAFVSDATVSQATTLMRCIITNTDLVKFETE